MWWNGFRVMKVLVAVIIFISSMAIPVLTFALSREDGVTPQSAQAGSGFQSNKLGTLRGEIIIKFKDEAIVGAVAEELIQGQQAFQEITGDANLDRLNARFKVRAMRRLFTKKGEAAGSVLPMTRQTAAQMHRQQREKFKADVAAVRKKRRKAQGLPADNQLAQKEVPYLVSVYHVEIDPKADVEQACREYASDPEVAYCQPNYLVQAQWTPNDPYYASFSSWGQGYEDMWGVKKLQAAEAWDVTRGAGAVVAVVDTGVDYGHIDLAQNIWNNGAEIPGNGMDDDANGFVDDVRGWDFTANDNDPADGHGHGTHVAGTIAAVGDNTTGIVGVAPSATIMPLKGLQDSGSGSVSGLANAIKYAADNGAHVINNSWGCSSPCSLPVAEDAVAYAHNLGSVVVFAAGNSKNDVTLYSPTNQSNAVITVAASSELDTRSYFSNFGSLIDVTAPGGGEDGTSANRIGRNILSLRAGATDMYGDGLSLVGDRYYRARGTSMAAPHVSGVAALIVANHPEFTPDDVSQVLRVSADDIEAPGFDLLSGAGRVNALTAVYVSSVPRVRINGPLEPINVRNSDTLTISGDAYGTRFTKYQLFYATLDKAYNNGTYTPTVGTWQALGGEVFQSVTDGVLGTFSINTFQPGRTYLLKLEVTTADNSRFTDVKELLFYEDDPRFYKLATATSYVMFPISAGDRFAWIDREPVPGETGISRYVGKVYDGATDKMVSIEVEGGDVTNIGLTSDRIVWDEGNTPQGGRVVIGSFNASGEITQEWTNGFGTHTSLASTDQDTVLLLHEDFDYTARIRKNTGYLMDARTKTISPGFPLADGDNINRPAIRAGSVLSGIYYPNTGRGDELYLTDTTTGVTQLIKATSTPNLVDRATNGSRAVVWVEGDWAANSFPLMMFDKTTQEIKTAAGYSHGSSFASEGDTILYSAWGNESGYTINNLYAYDIPTATTTLFATNYTKTDEMFPTFGTRHIQWVRGKDIIVRNETPVLAEMGIQIAELNKPLSIPISTSDPEGDKIDLAAMGGTWPGAPTALPAGATFTDNGDGTGLFQWTPDTSGTYTVSFTARDFTGRKDGTWNAAQTLTIQVNSDVTPPVTTAIPSGGIYFAAQTVTLTTNEPATIFYTLDGSTPTVGSQVYTSPLTISTTTTLRYFAMDTEGNIEAIKAETYTINTPPIASVSGTPASPTNATNAILIVGGDDVVAYKYQLDTSAYSDEIAVTTPIILGGLGEGVHTISVLGKNSYGIWQTTPTTVSWTVDVTPPTATVTGAPTGPTNSTNAILTVGGTDVVAYRYRLDGGAYSAETAVTTSISLSSLSDEPHSVEVIGKDSAGNWQPEAMATSVSFTVDTIAPVTGVMVSPAPNAYGWVNSNVTLNFSATDNLSGVAYLTINGAVFPSAQASYVLTTEGSPAANYFATDFVDVKEAVKSVVANIDKTPPLASVTTSPASLTASNKTKLVPVTINGYASDALSGIASVTITIADEYGVYNLTVPAFGSTVNLNTYKQRKDADGRVYTIKAVVTDKAGNQSMSTYSLIAK